MSEYTLDWLLGDTIVAVNLEQSDRWGFTFSSGGKVYVQCPWRVIQDETLRLSSADHQQQFGLPAPIDAGSELTNLLRGDTVISVDVVKKIGDIRITFRSGTELQVLPLSTGYEGWESWSPNGFNVIAQGGHTLVGFKP